MRLSLLQRIGLLILAMLPVAWGNCPGWFDGRGLRGAALESAGDTQARPACPCCAKRSHEGRPLRGCDDCPIVAVRRTASPVPPTVVLPPPVLIGLFLPPQVDVLQVRESLVVAIDARPAPGRPPDLVGTVVLLV